MDAAEPPDSPLKSLRRRGEPAPAFGEVSVGDTFLVVVEGKVTERLYLRGICGCLALGSVHVRVVQPGRHDPLGLIQEAMAERDAPKRRRAEGRASIRDPDAYDHVWTVFDTETSTQAAAIKGALDLAKNENIRVAFSTPSIEFWLLLHFQFTTGLLLDSAAAERALSAAWGRRYDKRADTFAKLWPALRLNISHAVTRAGQVRVHHETSGTPFPPNPATQVDLLVRALNASVQPPRRIFR